MEDWILPALIAFCFAVAGFAGIVQFAHQGKTFYAAVSGLAVFSAGGFFILAVAVAVASSDDLMDQLSWDGPRDFVVVSVGDDDFCGVLKDDDHVVCASNSALINYNRAVLGATKVLPIVGDRYSLKKTRVAGEKGEIIAYPR